MEQHLVGLAEGFQQGSALTRNAQQLLIGNHDQRVDALLQLTNSIVSLLFALFTFKDEGLSHHTDGQRTQFFGDLSHDGRATGSRSTTHAGGDEDHVGTLNLRHDVVVRLDGGPTTDLGIGSGAKALGQLAAEIDLAFGFVGGQRLAVRVGDDELYPAETALDHGLYGITATTADAEIIFGAVIDETMGENVSVTVIATGFGTGAQKMASEQLQRLNAMAEQQMASANMRLAQEPHPQTFEAINLSLEPTPAPVMAAPVSLPASAPTAAVGGLQVDASAMPQAKGNLPREALLAKARAFRESQIVRDGKTQEQLSMNVEEATPARLQPEPARSPFENDNLEVPAFLRRKRGLTNDQNEGMD